MKYIEKWTDIPDNLSILLVNMGNINLVDMECIYRHAPWYKCRGQRTTLRSLFSPPTMWLSGTKLWYSGLITRYIYTQSLLAAPSILILFAGLFTRLGWLVKVCVTGTDLFLPPQPWYNKFILTHPAFGHESWALNSRPHMCEATTLPNKCYPHQIPYCRPGVENEVKATFLALGSVLTSHCSTPQSVKRS